MIAHGIQCFFFCGGAWWNVPWQLGVWWAIWRDSIDVGDQWVLQREHRKMAVSIFPPPKILGGSRNSCRFSRRDWKWKCRSCWQPTRIRKVLFNAQMMGTGGLLQFFQISSSVQELFSSTSTDQFSEKNVASWWFVTCSLLVFPKNCLGRWSTTKCTMGGPTTSHVAKQLPIRINQVFWAYPSVILYPFAVRESLVPLFVS